MIDTPHTLRERIRQIKLPSHKVYSVHANMKIEDLVDTSLEDQILSLLQEEINKASVDELESILNTPEQLNRSYTDDDIRSRLKALKPKNGGKK